MTEACSIFELEALERSGSALFSQYSRIGVPLVEHHCRHCGALIYSRRQTRCGFCSRSLPATAVFTPAQSNVVRSVITEERQRHREWLRRHN